MHLANSEHQNPRSSLRELAVVVGLLIVVIGFCFYKIVKPDIIIFSNDGPIGAVQAYADYARQSFTGFWHDLNWVGGQFPGATPNLTQAIYWLLGHNAVLFAKFYTPAALFILGLAAWFFFRQLRFHPTVCVLGSLAAVLNMNFFSNACWGLPTRAFTLAGVFLALGLLLRHTGRWTDWARLAVAGLCVGLGIMEGYDVGALFSLYIAAFTLFLSYIQSPRPPGKWIVAGAARTAVIATFAAFISAQTLSTLVETQIKDVVEMESAEMDPIKKWNWTTQWSLPKAEILRVLIPGLYGYRMDTLGGGNYWGAVGRTPGWDQHHQGISRFSGSGEYAGILVILVALWALSQSLRKQASPFNLAQRQIIWFWTALAAVSVLLAFGRYAPFYHLIYPLPFFSTMRNPIKFMHPFHLGLIILFGYGMQDLFRRFLSSTGTGSRSLGHVWKNWWIHAPSMEKKWTLGLGVWTTGSVFIWLLMASSPVALAKYIQSQGVEAGLSELNAQFCIHELGLYVLFLVLSGVLFLLLLNRTATGPHARWIGLATGLLLFIDLARANWPWIQYWDYRSKYDNNPVINFLKNKAYEQRTVIFPFQVSQELALLQQVYGIEWSQHHFLYYRIPSLDIIQEPRETADNAAFRRVFPRETPDFKRRLRLWELTSTRYILFLAGGYVEALNQQFDPVLRRFRQALPFALTPKNGQPTKLEDYTAVEKADGPYAVVEFTGALPKAKLYASWQVLTNEQELLQKLAQPDFAPAQQVLLGQALPVAPAPVTPEAAGSAEIIHYTPKHIRIAAKANQPAVLLFNDKYDPNWKVWVDGQLETLFRCNYLMRGVYVPPGEHRIEFRFQPPHQTLYVSLAGWIIGIGLCGVLLVANGKLPDNEAPPKA